MTITAVQAKVTKTAAFNGTTEVDVSGIDGDWTLVLNIQAAAALTFARFAFEDSVDAFSASLSGPAFSIAGLTTAQGSRRFAVKKADFPSLRLGTASAVLRVSLTQITGTDASVTYDAWIESE